MIPAVYGLASSVMEFGVVAVDPATFCASSCTTLLVIDCLYLLSCGGYFCVGHLLAVLLYCFLDIFGSLAALSYFADSQSGLGLFLGILLLVCWAFSCFLSGRFSSLVLFFLF